MKKFPAALIVMMFLFCAGCDDSSTKNKPVQAPVSPPSRPGEETSTLQIPDFRKRSEIPKKKENTEKDVCRSPKKKEAGSGTAAPSEKEKGKKNSSSRKTMEKETSSGGGGNPAGDGGKNDGGSSEGAKSGRGNQGSQNGGQRKTVPADWTSADVKEPPSATNLEIWNNILVPLEKLIVARHVKFSPLGAKHTSLTNLSGGKYKACGRCTVTEKSGNQTAYEFECIAFVNKYEASVITVSFHSQNN